ncbi:hypothetical protein HPP92_017483 [Vanilla planifolia]|uniref:Uncharacterized protein n=1 Tax=Vanilla planifolia TaxID=51239 RepID=A0A835UR28_VANPL|nr:hypothetical protein HPP92_017483 [Vanilla planifolia]
MDTGELHFFGKRSNNAILVRPWTTEPNQPDGPVPRQQLLLSEIPILSLLSLFLNYKVDFFAVKDHRDAAVTVKCSPVDVGSDGCDVVATSNGDVAGRVTRP